FVMCTGTWSYSTPRAHIGPRAKTALPGTLDAVLVHIHPGIAADGSLPEAPAAEENQKENNQQAELPQPDHLGAPGARFKFARILFHYSSPRHAYVPFMPH
ncbi:MAG TPA: hypothetical protein PLG50_09925, partial [bacterium]|nr:hypothetical protein [bacterium]